MRHLARVTAFQTIYALDQGSCQLADALAHTAEEAALAGEGLSFCENLVQGWWAHREAIDTAIQANTTGWKLDRMMSVDRNILRLAVYELLYCRDVPKAVVINEAIELAKCYGDDDSRKFVNSILDKIARLD